jgi:hypothetical protein
MSKQKIPKKIQEIFDSITNKRAKIVIDHILEHGQITTEELEKDYGYNHAPRAARDVREAGIPLTTLKVKSKDGQRNIAAYTFGDFQTVRLDRVAGRINWPKNFKNELIAKYGEKCLISNADLESRALQIDHRIPYELVGDQNNDKLNVEDFMLLSGTSNRAKSWSCEHCKNLLEIKDSNNCKSCYWAYPENYSHVALNEARRLDLTWQGEEVKYYDALKLNSDEVGEELPEYVKDILRKNIK